MAEVKEKSEEVFEQEIEAADADAPQPWDPEKIRIVTKTFALGQVLEMLDESEIDLAPEFQRDYVWKAKQQSRLIESVLLGIPLPMFYLNQDDQLKMQVVDGLQRLTTIRNFAKNDFSLTDLEYLNELTDKRYEELSPVQKRRFRNTQIQSHVIDPETPFDLKFDIFRRINTGGSPLNAQEIRHCLSTNKVRDLLKRGSELGAFQLATDGALEKARRMEDREIVLRFFAFFLHEKDYGKYSGLDAFLGNAMKSLDQHSPDKLQALLTMLERSMSNNYAVFGVDAFRKFNPERRSPINRALFDCWSVVLADLLPSVLNEQRAAELREGAINLFNDLTFYQAISQGTDSERKVRYRFEKVRALVAKVCS